MTEQALKKQMRKEVKEKGGKIVFSNKLLQLSLYPTNENRRYYVSKAMLDEKENVLNIESFTMKRNGHDLWSILSIVDYWVNYAKLKQCKKVSMPTTLFLEDGFYSSMYKFHKDYIQCVLTQGFEKNEKEYTLDIENYTDIRGLFEKIKTTLKEKQEVGEAVKLTEQEKVNENGIYKANIEWKGHKAEINIYYNRKDQTLQLKDSKNIELERSVEEVEELISDYFKKVDQLRKIKNIYEPPTDNIKLLLRNGLRMYSVSEEKLMKQFMNVGYRYDEIENHAFHLMKSPVSFKKRVSNLRFFNQEAMFKFLNHYVLLMADDENKGYSNVFTTEEELFAHYTKTMDETLKKRIQESKEKMKEIN